MKRIALIITVIMLGTTLFGCTKGTNSAELASTQPKETQQITTSVPVPNKPTEKMADTIKIKLRLEGMEEERDAYLNTSKNGFHIYLLKGYTMEEADDGRTYISMDYDKEFYTEITPIKVGEDLTKWVETAKSNLSQFGEVLERDPNEHFDPYFRDAKTFLLASRAGKGSVMIMLKEVDGHMVQYEIHLPLKEAAEGAGPALWAMLKTVKFY